MPGPSQSLSKLKLCLRWWAEWVWNHFCPSKCLSPLVQCYTLTASERVNRSLILFNNNVYFRASHLYLDLRHIQYFRVTILRNIVNFHRTCQRIYAYSHHLHYKRKVSREDHSHSNLQPLMELISKQHSNTVAYPSCRLMGAPTLYLEMMKKNEIQSRKMWTDKSPCLEITITISTDLVMI